MEIKHIGSKRSWDEASNSSDSSGGSNSSKTSQNKKPKKSSLGEIIEYEQQRKRKI